MELFGGSEAVGCVGAVGKGTGAGGDTGSTFGSFRSCLGSAKLFF